MQFVILEHDDPVTHWDFMIETNGSLTTWRLMDPPDSVDSLDGLRVTAEPLPDHRLHYLDYEGPVSGDRGTVKRLDRGRYRQVGPGRFAIDGARLHGTVLIGQDSEREHYFVFVASSSPL